jgi:hypothetical protein
VIDQIRSTSPGSSWHPSQLPTLMQAATSTNGEIADAAAAVPEKEKAPRQRRFLMVDRTGIEPVTSGLQTHPIARPHLARIDRIGMTEPKSAVTPNEA